MTLRLQYYVNNKGYFILELIIVLGIISILMPTLLSIWLNYQNFITESQNQLTHIIRQLALKNTIRQQLDKGFSPEINEEKLRFIVSPYLYELSHDKKTNRLKRRLFNQETLQRRHSSYLTEHDVLERFKIQALDMTYISIEMTSNGITTSINQLMRP